MVLRSDKCLLRKLDGDGLCEPLNPLYIGLHGVSGDGGRAGATNIPNDYVGLLLDDSPARNEQAKTYRLLEKYVKSFEKQFKDVRDRLESEGKSRTEVRVKSLYLWSESPGTGKTTTSCALLNEWILRNYIGHLKRRESPPQRPGYFLDANALQTDYNTFNRPKVPENIGAPAAERYYNMIERAKKAPFAVLDDIGTRTPTEGFRDDLHSLINYRVSNEMPTVYTSNLPLDELNDLFGERRLADRIRDMTETIHFTGDSKRGKR